MVPCASGLVMLPHTCHLLQMRGADVSERQSPGFLVTNLYDIVKSESGAWAHAAYTPSAAAFGC
eukprot:2497110-Amphidinium_carterae.1